MADMETTQAAAVDSGASTPASSEHQPAPADSKSGATPTAPSTDPQAAGQAQVLPPSSYAPNFKFKVANQEREFDEWVRGAIKDQDTEKKVRELYEKAYGLDVVKPRFHETREKFRALEGEHAQYRQEVQGVLALRQGNLGKFFDACQIPRADVLKWVQDELQLTSEQRNARDAQWAAEQRALAAEQQVRTTQESFQQQAVQARTVELHSWLEMPEIRSIADAFDARVGQPGAFSDEVIKRGVMAYYSTGKDIPVQQAVQEVLRLYGAQQAQAPQGMTPQQGSLPNAAQTQAAVAATPGRKVPVLPAVSGGATSPVKRTVRSIADLKEIAKTL